MVQSLLSPGVQTNEYDFTQVIPAVSSSVASIVGRFSAGPILTPTLIASETQLVSVFGKPNDLNANEWFAAAEFLKYSSPILVTRASNSGVNNALAQYTGGEVTNITILNTNEYEQAVFDPHMTFVAKNSGSISNGIAILMIDAATWGTNAVGTTAGTGFLGWCDANLALFPNKISLATHFNSAPNTSSYVKGLAQDTTPKNDEVHILVVDTTGAISGTPYTVLEKFEAKSKASDAIDYNGLSIYYPNVINNVSKYVWFAGFPDANTGLPFGSTALEVAGTGLTFSKLIDAPFYNVTMSNGQDGTAATLSEIQSAIDVLKNKDLYKFDLFISGSFGLGTTAAVEQYAVQSLAAFRKDCVAFVTPSTNGSPIRDGITADTQILAFKTAAALADTDASYGFMDTGFKYIYDKYSKKYRYVPMCGDTAGLAARTDSTNAPWWAFGGYNRGGLKNVIKFAYNPSETSRNLLYPQGINPIFMDASDGPILLGDRTMTVKPSAFGSIGIRRLFIVLESAIKKMAKYQLFEFNDSFTQSTFKNIVTPFLKSVKGGRGLIDFNILCDSTNNTPYVVQNKQFVGQIYIVPNYAINGIILDFVATDSNVMFTTTTV